MNKFKGKREEGSNPILPKHTTRYPWAKWVAKGRIRLIKGVDYHYASYVMAGMIRNAVSKARPGIPKGTRVSYRIAEDQQSIMVVFTPPPTVGGRTNGSKRGLCKLRCPSCKYEGVLVPGTRCKICTHNPVMEEV